MQAHTSTGGPHLRLWVIATCPVEFNHCRHRPVPRKEDVPRSILFAVGFAWDRNLKSFWWTQRGNMNQKILNLSFAFANPERHPSLMCTFAGYRCSRKISFASEVCPNKSISLHAELSLRGFRLIRCCP